MSWSKAINHKTSNTKIRKSVTSTRNNKIKTFFSFFYAFINIASVNFNVLNSKIHEIKLFFLTLIYWTIDHRSTKSLKLIKVTVNKTQFQSLEEETFKFRKYDSKRWKKCQDPKTWFRNKKIIFYKNQIFGSIPSF